VTLEAVNCVTGASLERAGAKAESKEKVLDALGKATSDLRGKLGESLASVQKYDVPLEQATTSSLEALKTYSLGLKIIDEKGSAAAIPYFKRAIELDPNFAEAYWVIAVMYGNIGETELASEYAQRAYTLRDRVTELEKLDLEVTESSYVTGDLVKDEENCELHIRTYPRDPGAYVGLASDRAARGDYEGEVANVRRSLDIFPRQSIALGNLAEAYMALNRLDEAKSALDRGVAIGIGPEVFIPGYYNLAFLRKDEQGMQEQFALAMGKSDYEDAMLSIQSDTEA